MPERPGPPVESHAQQPDAPRPTSPSFTGPNTETRVTGGEERISSRPPAALFQEPGEAHPRTQPGVTNPDTRIPRTGIPGQSDIPSSRPARSDVPQSRTDTTTSRPTRPDAPQSRSDRPARPDAPPPRISSSRPDTRQASIDTPSSRPAEERTGRHAPVGRTDTRYGVGVRGETHTEPLTQKPEIRTDDKEPERATTTPPSDTTKTSEKTPADRAKEVRDAKDAARKKAIEEAPVDAPPVQTTGNQGAEHRVPQARQRHDTLPLGAAPEQHRRRLLSEEPVKKTDKLKIPPPKVVFPGDTASEVPQTKADQHETTSAAGSDLNNTPEKTTPDQPKDTPGTPTTQTGERGQVPHETPRTDTRPPRGETITPRPAVEPAAAPGNDGKDATTKPPAFEMPKPGQHLGEQSAVTVYRPNRRTPEEAGRNRPKEPERIKDPKTVNDYRTNSKIEYRTKPPTLKTWPPTNRNEGYTHPKYKAPEKDAVQNGTGEGYVPKKILDKANGGKDVSPEVLDAIKNPQHRSWDQRSTRRSEKATDAATAQSHRDDRLEEREGKIPDRVPKEDVVFDKKN